MEFLHPAMWHVALGWHAIEFAQTSAILQFYIWFDFDHITAVDMSFCTTLRNFIQIGPPSAEKMTSCRFSRWRILAVLDFMDPIMGSLKSPCTTSYRSSMNTVALNCWVFEKIAFLFAFWRQTDKQTDGQHRCTKPLSFLTRSVAAGFGWHGMPPTSSNDTGTAFGQDGSDVTLRPRPLTLEITAPVADAGRRPPSVHQVWSS